MRKLIVKILATAASFYVTQYFLTGFQIEQTWSAYLVGSLVFVVFNFLLTPIIKLLLLPINLLTLGLFRWLTNVLVLYLFDLVYDGVRIAGFTYPGFTSPLLSLPSGPLNLFWVLVLSSLLMSLIYSLISALFQAQD
jgi:putative membrane protein